MDIYITAFLIVVLFAILGSGVSGLDYRWQGLPG